MVKNKNRNNNNFFLIAEAGINHGGNFQKAIKLINTAKETGAHAIKFQTYKTEKRVSRKNKVFDILKKCELNFFDFEKLKKYCEKKKIIFFSTPFDKESVNFLNDINVKLFKIASFDISNYDLIDEIIKTKKKTILSTGMASLNEIKKTYKKFSSNNIDCSLLHCISAYPNKDENSYLSNILFLKNNFNCNIGLSDHTKDIKTSIYSYLLGARIFEKHFKLNNKDNCVDKDVSLTPFQMKLLFNELTKITKILGRARFGIRPEEREALKFKRKKVLS